MKVTWYPKNLLVAAALLMAFAFALSVGIGFRNGATVGFAALLVYLLLDVVLTFNPADWGSKRKHRSHR